MMKNNQTIDEIDRRILNILQSNARTPNAEIARSVGMAPSAIGERIKKLEQRGVILGYETRLASKAVDRSLTAFTFVHIGEETVGSQETGRKLAEIPEVLEVHYCAGQDSYLLKLRVRDTAALADLLRRLGSHGAVRDTRTTVVLGTIKETLALPLRGPLQGDDA